MSLKDTIHVRVCCRDWDNVRSTVRMPMESSAEREDAALGCVVDFPGLTVGQWDFLRPELDRLASAYDYIDHTSGDAQWVTRLTSCR